jgi:hypothetical protein
MPTGPKAYTINFKYPEGGESVIVIANSYASALDEAYEERASTSNPTEVEIIDPTISSVLSFIGNTAKEAASRGVQAIRKYGVPAAKLGAKYAIKGARVGAETVRQTATEHAYKFELGNVQKLIKASYSDKRLTRNAARRTLKNFYPEVYRIMDFSEPSHTKTLRKMAVAYKRGG